MLKNGMDTNKQTAMMIAYLMAAAARTAPKGRGYDNLEIVIVDGPEKDALASRMREIGTSEGLEYYNRNSDSVDEASVVVLMGTKNNPVNLSHCGFCGYRDCSENMANGGNCVFNITDLGIAMGSAVALAASHGIDNRIMISAGKAALELHYFPENVKIAWGIPLSVSSKNIFFDRK